MNVWSGGALGLGNNALIPKFLFSFSLLKDRGEKLKAIWRLVFVSVIVVALTTGISYLWANKSLSEREEKIDSLQENIVELQGKLIDKSKTISSLEGEIDNTKKFWRLLLRSVNGDLGDAFANMEAGDTYYDEFLSYYEEGYYESAEYFADSVDVYFDYAMTKFIEAKGSFMATKKYAPDERSLRLVENYIDLCEYAIDMSSEMHQAGEYHSTACDYYAKEQWSLGDEALEEGNKHIDAHDNLIDYYNDCWANIVSFLEE